VLTIWYLANDAVTEWVVASMNSLRAVEPDVAVKVIPYDDRIEQLCHLLPRWNADIVDWPLSDYDALGETVGARPSARGMFRKLALLGLSDGPNLYIDSDTVILRQLLPFADAWSESGADLAVADADVPQAFHPGPLAQRTLGFNAGFFIARAGLTDLSNLQTLATDALRVVDQFVIENVDQPFFNFVCDEAGWDVRTITQLVPGTPYCTWSERAIDPVQPWIHWAGRSLAYDMSHRELWVRWRLEGAAPAEKARFRLGETRTALKRTVRHLATRRSA
jgi:hypothetical protein